MAQNFAKSKAISPMSPAKCTAMSLKYLLSRLD
jgi:hypothetical protein